MVLLFCLQQLILLIYSIVFFFTYLAKATNFSIYTVFIGTLN